MGDELQCAFIEEICKESVEDIYKLTKSDPDFEDSPLFLCV
jgi:hypothetical protein